MKQLDIIHGSLNGVLTLTESKIKVCLIEGKIYTKLTHRPKFNKELNGLPYTFKLPSGLCVTMDYNRLEHAFTTKKDGTIDTFTFCRDGEIYYTDPESTEPGINPEMVKQLQDLGPVMKTIIKELPSSLKKAVESLAIKHT